MKKSLVKITETLIKSVEIIADNPDEAEEQTRKKYRACEIVLDTDDYVGTDFEIEVGGEC